MTQSHLVIDFPIKGAAHAKALPEELPPLMADLARAQDDLGTVHFSRFIVVGDEKLLFLSDIDGETDLHIDRLVGSAGPVFDVIFEHVLDAPPTPAGVNRAEVGDWLRQHVHEPLETYFAFPETSVQDIKACVREAGFTGNASQNPLLTYMSFKSQLRASLLELVGPTMVGKKGHEGMEAIGTVHVAHWVPFEKSHVGFWTVYDGDMEKYIQDFAEEISIVFDKIFPHIEGAPPTPVGKNAEAFYQWALNNNYPPIGFYSAYPGLSVQDIRALLADREAESASA